MKKMLIIIVFVFPISIFAQDRVKGVCFKTTNNPKDIRSEIKYYQSLLTSNNKDQKALYFLATCYYRLHDFKNAIFTYDTLIELNPAYPGALSGRGICKYFSKDKEGGCADFRRSIELGQDPDQFDGGKLSEFVKKNCGSH